MRRVAMLTIFLAAAGCAEGPTWKQAGQTAVFVGASALMIATGGSPPQGP